MSERELRARIRKLARMWRDRLGLTHVKLHVDFDEPRHLASADSDDWYLEHSLHFNLERIADEVGDDGDLSKLVLHEVCHYFTYPIARLATVWGRSKARNNMVEKLEEQHTTLIERALWDAWEERDGVEPVQDHAEDQVEGHEARASSPCLAPPDGARPEVQAQCPGG